ncbi:MAG: hypothetical protein V1816_26975 [Pseudomonadota bacterium]
MIRKYWIIFTLLTAWSVAVLGGCGYFPKPDPIGDHPPVIDDYFASPEIQWGHTWRIYIKAHDPDGDMWEVDFQIDQPGKLHAPGTGLVILPKRLWAEIDGYFYFEILASPFALGYQNLTYYVQLIDRGERRSKKIKIPLHVGMKPALEAPERFRDKPPLFRIPMDIHVENDMWPSMVD